MKLPCDFGEYILEEELGQGGMGDVYLAMRKRDGANVAIKTIHPHLSRLKQFMARFHREAKMLEKLAHPRVVRLYESGTVTKDEETTHYIAMECVKGAKLSEVIDGKHTDVDTNKMTLSVQLDGKSKTVVLFKGVIHMLRQIAAVLQEAHQLGIVHRDIKPENIIVTNPKWDIKLLDFGIARDAEDLQRSISQTGHVLGTPPFMSPEQCAGNTDIDIRSDLYALGIVAYQCLAGTLPFNGPTTMAYIQQHLHMAPAPLCQLNSDIPENLAQVIDRLLAKERILRHQTPAELIEDLNRIERGWPPLKIYSFENRELSETSAEGGERITPTSDELVLAQTTPLPPPSFIDTRKRGTPVPEQEKKSKALLVIVVVFLVAVVAAYFVYSRLTGDKQPSKEEPVAQTPVDDKPEEQEGPLIPVEEPWEAEWNKLVADGDKLLAQDDYKDALESYNKALALHDEPGLRDKIARAEQRFELFKRQQQQDMKFRDLVAQGDKNFDSGYYDAAIPLYEEALKIQHDDKVKDKLTQAEEAKNKEEERIELKKQYDTCMKNAMADLEKKDWEKALTNLSRALKMIQGGGARYIDSGDELIELQEKCEMAMLQLGKYKRALNAAKVARSNHDFEGETEAIKRAISNGKKDNKLEIRLEELKRLLSLKAEMTEAEKKGNWQEMKKAAEELDKAGYPPAAVAFKKAEQEIRYADLCDKATKAEESGDLEKAISCITEAEKIKTNQTLFMWKESLRDKLAVKSQIFCNFASPHLQSV